MPIKNEGKQIQTLLRTYFVTVSEESQFSVVPRYSTDTPNSPSVSILPSETYDLKLACLGKYLGHCKQLCIFEFGSFKIGRYVAATVEDKHMVCIGPIAPYCPAEKKKPSYIYRDDSRIVRGEKPYKAPAFLPTSLPQYQIPMDLFAAVLNKEDILELVPLLREPVSPDNYQDNFSTLLHLEEIEMTLQMRKVSCTKLYSCSKHT